MVGACLIAGRAALREGAGSVALGVLDERVVVDYLEPRLMFAAAETLVAGNPDVLAIGPGLGQHPRAHALMGAALAAACPLVLDADALNLLACPPQRSHPAHPAPRRSRAPARHRRCGCPGGPRRGGAQAECALPGARRAERGRHRHRPPRRPLRHQHHGRPLARPGRFGRPPHRHGERAAGSGDGSGRCAGSRSLAAWPRRPNNLSRNRGSGRAR